MRIIEITRFVDDVPATTQFSSISVTSRGRSAYLRDPSGALIEIAALPSDGHA